MALSVLHSRAISGLSVISIRVEVDLALGLPSFSIVGLPDAAVRESRERVRAAIHNSGFEFPSMRVTVNLAPADLPKDSGRFDLPIALGILAASHQIGGRNLESNIARREFVGELSMTGTLLPVRGAFALAMDSVSMNGPCDELILPLANRTETSLTQSPRLRFAANLREVAMALKTGQGLHALEWSQGSDRASDSYATSQTDWSDIAGQVPAKTAAVIAAAGRHNLLMFGPPGVGKSMIASRLPALMPRLSHREACELAAIRSIDQGLDPLTWRHPPYRSPHHSTPSRALIGGGQPVRPGEISLAHHGVLFLDELPEFSRDALESLREPLETGEISVARVRERIRLPADVMLVAAMNPCPCGYFGVRHARRACKCPPDRIERYRSKISGPLLDRFDMAIQLEAVGDYSLNDRPTKKESPIIAEQIAAARDTQLKRQSTFNSRLSVTELQQVAVIDADCERLLNQVARQWGWSARAWHRTLRVARTIADLARASTIDRVHISQAIELRRAMDGPSG